MSESSGGPGPPDPFNMYNVVHRGEMPTLAESVQMNFKTSRHSYFTHSSESEKYFVISGDAVKNMDVFEVHEGLLAISKEKFKKTIRLQSGDILVQTSNAKQIKALQATKTIGDDKKPVSISENGVLNQCQAIIRCKEIMKVDESRILSKLKDQKVTAVHRLKRKENGKWVDTPTHILTFSIPVCPKEIDVGYLTVPTEIFIPAPFRCSICQKLGHTKKRCKSGNNRPTCGVCGQAPHDFNYPCFIPKCINCNGPHPSYSKQCPRYIEENEINAARVTLRIPYTLAREEVRKRRSTAPTKTLSSEVNSSSTSTYSQIASSSKNINSTRQEKTSISESIPVNRSQGLSRIGKARKPLTIKAFKRAIQIESFEKTSNTQTTQIKISQSPLKVSNNIKQTRTQPDQNNDKCQEMLDISQPQGLPGSSHNSDPNSSPKVPFNPSPPSSDFSIDSDPEPPDIEISDS